MDQEQPNSPVENSKTARVLRWVISIVVLLICTHMQWWLVLHGEAGNILHQNAQFYGFVLIAAILGGLGIGEAIGTVASAFKK